MHYWCISMYLILLGALDLALFLFWICVDVEENDALRHRDFLQHKIFFDIFIKMARYKIQ